MMLQVGTNEILLDDSVRMAVRAAHADVEVVLDVVPGAPHVFQGFAGTGTLESWVDMHRAYWDGYKDNLPYRVCLVRLTEGPVIASNLIDSTDNLKMGMKVKVVYDPVTEEVTLPKFTIAET